jgi:alpha-tubulin suppressor-like RCC1 family protein
MELRQERSARTPRTDVGDWGNGEFSMRRTLVCVVSALTAGIAAMAAAPAAPVAATPVPGYRALVPERVLDTRSSLGHAGALAAGETVALDVTGVGGVPATGVGAVAINITATQATEATFVTVWPGDQARPTTSNLNPGPGADTPNLVIATVAADGTINLYNEAGSVHLLADVTGWFPAGSGYTALTPARVLDTRSAVGTTATGVPGGGSITLDVTGVGGVPATGVGAVVVNVTATNVTEPTWVTVWPGGRDRPTASNVNTVPGDDASNLVIATVGADGTINLYNDAGDVDLLADVTGWFPAGVDYQPLTPARVLDTRSLLGAPGPVGAGQTVTLDVTGVAGVPEAGVGAVVLNVTGALATDPTWITVWPSDAPRPVASNLNLVAGRDTPNLVIATVGADGTIRLYNDSGSTALIADVSGWFPADSAGAVEGGRDHSCALADDGAVECWGYNGLGQLGNGTTTDSTVPVAVSGITGAVAVTTGDYHSCALLETGTVSCWGYNEGGQVGNGTMTAATTPSPVSGLTGATSVSAGSYHTCATLIGGIVSCWGYNGFGQLGNGTTTDASTPVAVSGLTGVSAISSGGYHTCAIVATTVKCWGANDSGQLGDGTTTASPAPVVVTGLTAAGAIAGGGFHTCALLTTGTASCWGANVSGQLGNGSTTGSSTPVAVSGLTGAGALAAGEFHNCAVTSGSVQCWGEGGDGQLGAGTTTASPTPVTVTGITDARDVAAGINHSCAVLGDADLRCWGANGTGQLGDGTTTSRSIPVAVAGS